MLKIVEKISTFTILILGAVSVVLVALIYFGGSAGSLTVGEESLDVPKFTDAYCTGVMLLLYLL